MIFFRKNKLMHCALRSAMHFALLVIGICAGNNSNAQISVGNLTVLQASVAADSVTASVAEIRPDDTAILRVSGGSLGADANWVWREGSCTGTIVGTGDSILVSPTSSTEYFCTAEGGCNTVVCRSVMITVDDSPLPLQLFSFTAQLYQQHKALLEWETALEINTSHFVIEESFDGAIYQYLGKVSAANASGNHKYQFIDEQLKNGLNYYRLKMIDIDGATSYSPVRFVNYQIENTAVSSVKLYPNPTGGDVVLELESPVDGTIAIWTTSIVAQKNTDVIKMDVKKGKNIIPVKTDALADGTYMLYYQINDAGREGIKFVKATR